MLSATVYVPVISMMRRSEVYVGYVSGGEAGRQLAETSEDDIEKK